MERKTTMDDMKTHKVNEWIKVTYRIGDNALVLGELDITSDAQRVESGIYDVKIGEKEYSAVEVYVHTALAGNILYTTAEVIPGHPVNLNDCEDLLMRPRAFETRIWDLERKRSALKHNVEILQNNIKDMETKIESTEMSIEMITKTIDDMKRE